MLKTEGIVIGETRYKDTSKIINLYTRKLGKISVMAQGAIKPKSQLLATTQPFSYSEFQLRKGRNFYYILQADLLNSFYPIRDNMERIGYGFYMLELLNKSTPDEEENEKLFLLLKKGLEVLSSLDKEFLKFIVAYELKYISFLGYRPYIDRCVVCNEELKENMKFSKNLGGVLCPKCFTNDITSYKINKSFIYSLSDLLYAPLEELDSKAINDQLLKYIHDVLVDYILFNIDRKEFKSINLINSMG
ncbi:DNA repair protein RecO [Tissierella sp. Yu-01]|uniref:DNA repair protein RecO n=1 Tax=Tissierella sp. Yu-01 TaxID=3035694 RepID=UPI00240E96F2|nr:DNA repair protein RecO [Tissierella sp. Yu-01]WFA09557.1 DNA repair protein RecO [Tissierella sp. Yu-01]